MQELENMTGEEPGKTFSQEQLNAIVGKRLSEQKSALMSEFDKREKELSQREMTIKASELLNEKGLPKELANILRYEDEESLKAAIGILENIRGMRPEEDSSKFKVLGDNRLPTGTHEQMSDPIKEAFKRS